MTYLKTDTSDYQKLMETYSIKSLLAKVLSAMKYDEHDIASFFNPLIEYELDQLVFQPIKDCLKKAREENRKVFIFGDYDCDGICGTAIVKKILDKMGIENGFYIPNRLDEGYGLSLEKLRLAYEKGYEVLITVDNGVSSRKALDFAKEKGMTAIVTDHHIITQEVNCDYLLHPSLLSEDYRYLCGSGLVFLLAHYLDLADASISVLAMIATIADVMSLKGANVKIVRDGLKILNQGLYKNILALDKFYFPLTEEDVAYRICPKINAVGRMADIANVNNVVRFLLTDDSREISSLASQIVMVNNTRLQLSKEQNELVKREIRTNDIFNLIYLPQLHEGLLGLIASRIADETRKVTFVMTDSLGQIKGSGRSNGMVDIIAMLEDFRADTLALGGHEQACGLTIEKNKLSELESYLKERLSQYDDQITEEYVEVGRSDLTVEKMEELFSWRPFGQDRRLPLLKVTIEDVIDYVSLKNENQLKWITEDLEFISFNNRGYSHYLDKDSLEVYGYLQENNFRGKLSYQIMIKDIIE